MVTELKLWIKEEQKKSILEECFFTSPLKIGMPQKNKETLHLILMMASPGVLKGDSFAYDIWCKENSKVLITEQSYTKLFDMGEGTAEKNLNIRLEKGASLFYRPCAVIPFRGSWFDGMTQVELDKESEFFYSDLVTAGRIGMGEKFAFRHYRSRVCVSVDGQPVWLEQCLLEPEQMDLTNMGFFDHFTHQGTLYYYGPTEKIEEILQYETNRQVAYGRSLAAKGVCVRILAQNAQDIEEVLDEIAAKLK